jgi:hypothetical protein
LALALTEKDTHTLARALMNNKKNIASFMFQHPDYKFFINAYNGLIDNTDFNHMTVRDIILGLLCAKRYDQALEFIIDILPIRSFVQRFGAKLYTTHVSKVHTYEEIIELIEKCVSIPELQTLKKYLYERCCTILAYESRINDIKRMLNDKIITLEDIKKIAIDHGWSECGMNQQVYELIDYNLPQIVNNCLTTFMFYEPNPPALPHLLASDEYYIESNIDLIQGLHIRDINFKVSKRAYEQAIRSKDLLTIKYIDENNLCE